MRTRSFRTLDPAALCLRTARQRPGALRLPYRDPKNPSTNGPPSGASAKLKPSASSYPLGTHTTWSPHASSDLPVSDFAAEGAVTTTVSAWSPSLFHLFVPVAASVGNRPNSSCLTKGLWRSWKAGMPSAKAIKCVSGEALSNHRIHRVFGESASRNDGLAASEHLDEYVVSYPLHKAAFGLGC